MAFARFFLNLLGSISIGATLTAFLWPLFFQQDLGLQILTTLLLAGAYYYLLWLTRPRLGDDRVSLGRGTVKFANYYRDFYALEGSLSIFCEDTEWLEGDVMKRVVEAIAAKKSRATMYLSILDEPITTELEKRGVRIIQVPANFALEVKMSYRVNGTERDLMIRGAADGTSTTRIGKNGNKEVNTFTRTSNLDFVNLAKAIFGAIEDPSRVARQVGGSK